VIVVASILINGRRRAFLREAEALLAKPKTPVGK
jgi:hypothetical protein